MTAGAEATPKVHVVDPQAGAAEDGEQGGVLGVEAGRLSVERAAPKRSRRTTPSSPTRTSGHAAAQGRRERGRHLDCHLGTSQVAPGASSQPTPPSAGRWVGRSTAAWRTVPSPATSSLVPSPSSAHPTGLRS